MENIYGPFPRVVIAIKLDEMVVRGTPVKVTLHPTGLGWMDGKGRAQFTFFGRWAIFDSQTRFSQTFVSPAEDK
jgi:hypothetical protein